MVVYWRQAGLNYLQFSRVAAKAVRKCLKPELQTEAVMKKESDLKVTKWLDGKASKETKTISL